MPLNLPIILTWARIAAVPLLLIIFIIPDETLSLVKKNLFATLLFVFTAITDWLDGYIARRWNLVSRFGAFLDPVADKLLVTATLLVLLQLGRTTAVLALIIIGREIAVSALREWMAQLGAGKKVAVNMWGKIKTVLQLVALPFLLYAMPLQFAGITINSLLWGEVLLYIAALMTLLSMFFYLSQARKAIKDSL